MVTRFAPTPSGYLHVGNAANAVLVHRLARRHGGRALLRIDDIDTARSRAEYVDDVLDLLAWLGLDSHGTVHQTQRLDRYRAALAAPHGALLYACACSRRDLAGVTTGGCPGGCRGRGLEYRAGETAVRIHVPEGTVVPVDDVDVSLDETLGDFVVWRRDDQPAYQLASVVDDVELGITHIVRGTDLRESTAAQLFLADQLGLASFATITVLHHALATGADGTKLSKSQAVRGHPLPRTEQARTAILRLADALGAPWGLVD